MRGGQPRMALNSHQQYQWRYVAVGCFLLQLILLSSISAKGDSLIRKPSKSRTPTRVLGFASSKRSSVLVPRRENTPDNETSLTSKSKNATEATQKVPLGSNLYAQYCHSSGVLFLQSAGTIVQISANEERIWQSSVVSPDKSPQNFTVSPSASNWVPVEGLFGIYEIPSGSIWVLITGSESVYDAPMLSNSQSWLSIRRVTDLELVHIPCRLLSVPQLKEEVRQVQLLRKALKQHDFYYIPHNDNNQASIVPDMTKNLQRSFRAYLGKGASESEALVNTHEEEDCESIERDVLETEGDLQIQVEEEADLNAEVNPVTFPGVNIGRHIPWWENPDNKDDANRPDSRFFWNEVAVEPLLERYREHKKEDNSNSQSTKLLLQSIIPLTSAFVGIAREVPVESVPPTKNPALLYDELLISRRSRYRAGTRFTKRGADATGAVANYAETEQVCLLLSNSQWKGKKQYVQQVTSHVQTRGSIPLRWSSPTDIKTYRPRVRIGMDPMAQTRACLTHIMEQLSIYTMPESEDSSNSTYPKLLFVNLIDKKSDQGRLGRAFDSVLNALMEVYAPANATNTTPLDKTASNTSVGEAGEFNQHSGQNSDQCITLLPNSVQHLWYDFHAMVKNGRWDRLGSLLKEVKPVLLKHGYFCVQAPRKRNTTWRIMRYQKAVVRTNCMDCLDRTNVVQGLFGRFMLFHQLKQLALPLPEATNRTKSAIPLENIRAFRKNTLTLPWENGELAHRLLWADNADAISRLYAGTPALKGDFTRTGKRTKRGALDDGMNSLQRYYLNNFLDADRQEGTDLMVGYAPFSNIDDTAGDASDSHGHDVSGGVSSMTLQEAARQMLLGNNVYKPRGADEDRFARIKEYESLPYLRKSLDGVSGGASAPSGSKPRYRDLRRPPLDLRWLPGDIQDNLRSRALAAAADSEAKLSAQFCSADALAAIDRRAASDEPWWIAADSSDDESTLVDHRTAKAELGASNNHAGYLLGTFLFGTRAPLSTAAFVVALLGAMYLPSFIERDGLDKPHGKL